ncbi:hypothetical protein EN985_18675 [Mesorhizobium sp. M7A.F.Ca.CA.004.04.1.1]|nr:hypothetical protein EN985_18675 [Mesorhizobium sp. M7A.F.Ca.CA.004.04.1.1]
MFAEIGQPETKTVTIRFCETDAWSDADPEAIVRTFKVYRTIRLASRQLSLGLGIDERRCGGPHSFELSCAVAEITSSCRIVGTSLDPSECLPVMVHLDGEYLRSRIDMIASITVHLKSFDRHEIAAQLSYVLAHFACGYEFISQARDLATLIRQRRYRCQSRNVAAVVAARLNEHPTLAGDLAALNGIHERQDEAYLLYVHSLLSSSLPFEERLATASRFYVDALEFHAAETPERQSAIHYSFGNALRISGAMSRAVRQYNLARRKYPDYLRRGYFLAELAAALFFRGRHRMAATLYDHAYEADAKPQVAICAGDAHLFCGHFAEAHRCYDAATNSDDICESSEAALKDWMATWVEQFSYRNYLTYSPHIWMSVLEQSVEAERRDHAIGACLMLCYLTEDNLPFWARAISLTTGGEDRDLLFAVIAGAVWTHGQAAYALFRDGFRRAGGSSDALRNLDGMVGDLFAQRTSSSKGGVTTRLLREHHYDSVVEEPTNP